MISVPFHLPPSPMVAGPLTFAWERLPSRDSALVTVSRTAQTVTIVPGIRVVRPTARDGRCEAGGAALRGGKGMPVFREAIGNALREVMADDLALSLDMALWRANE